MRCGHEGEAIVKLARRDNAVRDVEKKRGRKRIGGLRCDSDMPTSNYEVDLVGPNSYSEC